MSIVCLVCGKGEYDLIEMEQEDDHILMGKVAVSHLACVEKLQVEMAALKERRCETCEYSVPDASDGSVCDGFSKEYLAFIRDHCNDTPVYCSRWTAREGAGDE